MSNNSTPRVLALHDSYRPGVKAGKYTVTVSHALDSIPESKAYFTDAVQDFEIEAPRFTLPPGTIHGVYPQHSAYGDYTRVLPHVAFDNESLPWQRLRAAGADDRDPWLGILIFAENELPADPHAQGAVQTMTVTEFLTDAPGIHHPYIDINDVPAELRATEMNVIDVPAPLFEQQFPHGGQFKHTAHVRRTMGAHLPVTPAFLSGVYDGNGTELYFSWVQDADTRITDRFMEWKKPGTDWARSDAVISAGMDGYTEQYNVANTDYQYRMVYATNVPGQERVESNIVHIKFGEGNVTAQRIHAAYAEGAEALKVTWDSPIAGPIYAAYIEISANDGPWQEYGEVYFGDTSHTITLDWHDKWYRVRMLQRSNVPGQERVYSNTVFVPGEDQPDVPQTLRVSDYSDTEVQISWGPYPHYMYREAITVKELIDGKPTKTYPIIPGKLTRSAVIGDLQPGTQHTFIVQLNGTSGIASFGQVNVTTDPPYTGDRSVQATEYSVVTAMRIPRWNQKYCAHLVSLEDVPVPTDGTSRLASLHQWTFTCGPDSDPQATSFSAVVNRLAAPADDKTRLRLHGWENTDGLTPDITGHLTDGYVPTAWHTPSGEGTLAWYRGPLTPYPVPALPDPAVHNAAAYLAYNKDGATFDVTYAAAFTLGRLLTLQDPAFCQQLLNHQQLKRRHAGHARQRTALRAAQYSMRVPDQSPPHPARTRFAQLLADGLADRMDASLNGKPVPNPAPTQYRIAPKTYAALAAQAMPGVPVGKTDDFIVDWLSRLATFDGIPLRYLIPHSGLLPEETLKFFRVDPNWMTALAIGSLTVGADDPEADGTDLPDDFTDMLAPCGMVINSRLVPGWPSVRIAAAKNGAGVGIRVRRNLSEQVMIVLFDAVPDEVTLTQPETGLHLGLTGQDKVEIRDIETGNTIYEQDAAGILRYPNDQSAPWVIDYDKLTAVIEDQNRELVTGSADTAYSLIQAPHQQTIGGWR